MVAIIAFLLSTGITFSQEQDQAGVVNYYETQVVVADTETF